MDFEIISPTTLVMSKSDKITGKIISVRFLDVNYPQDIESIERALDGQELMNFTATLLPDTTFKLCSESTFFNVTVSKTKCAENDLDQQDLSQTNEIVLFVADPFQALAFLIELVKGEKYTTLEWNAEWAVLADVILLF